MRRASLPEAAWTGGAFRRALTAMVRRRVPERDVEDVVQATLAEGLSPAAPKDDATLQRWLFGVARHKIADRARRGRRESFDVPELATDAPAHAARDLIRWAERALPDDDDDARRTLEWLLREGDGEKLEAIAESERLPAPRVRKRVSRLRSHLRAQWKKEIALLVALGVIALLVWLARPRHEPPIVKEPPRPAPTVIAPPPSAPAVSSAPPIAPVPSASAAPSARPRPMSTSRSSL